MINLYGIDFPDEEVDIVMIEGKPEWVLSIAGARRAATYAPDPNVRAEFLALLDRIEAGYRG